MKNSNSLSKQQQRYQIIILADRKLITAKKAAEVLGISIRQVRRLIKQLREDKLLTSIPRLPWNGLAEEIRKEIINLKKEQPERSNQYIGEMIEQKFGQRTSRETVRRVLISEDCYPRIKRERRVFSKLEEQIVKCGQMLQMDTLEGAFLKGYRRVYLIAIMDAYSRYIVGWKWTESDGVWQNIEVLRVVIEKYGIPGILYTDNASFFKVIRKNQSFYQKHRPDDEYETTIQRIMLDLGSVLVTHKPYEPQGKGRLERFFWFVQQRFILEHNASNLKGLNQQFKKWVKWYNTCHVIRTIGCRPKNRFNPNGFKPVPEDLDLERVFSYQYTRRIDKYNSFSFESVTYLIDKQKCGSRGHLVGYQVNLYVTPKTIFVYHRDTFIQKFKRILKN